MTGKELHIKVSLGEQALYLLDGDTVLKTYRVSTARNGPGERQNSECTPRGSHRIARKIGAGAVPGTVFVGREPTGEIYASGMREDAPGRDWILTRILRLEGLEAGVNRGGEVDTYARMIYIHGCPEDIPMGIPGSHGCIRMRNADVIDLFDRVVEGTRVEIKE